LFHRYLISGGAVATGSDVPFSQQRESNATVSHIEIVHGFPPVHVDDTVDLSPVNGAHRCWVSLNLNTLMVDAQQAPVSVCSLTSG
jgi:hypothetical protein